MVNPMLKLLSPVKLGAWNSVRFFLKHYYIVILIIVLLPVILGSIQDARDARNPAIPAVRLVVYIVNSDAGIDSLVNQLRENPDEVIGVPYPERGIWRTTVYYSMLFWNVILVILGLLWALAIPFIAFYKINRAIGSKGLQSSRSADTTKALFYGIIFIFIVNLLIISTGILMGTVESTVTEGSALEPTAWLVVLKAFPFHGIANLIQFITTLT